VKSSGETKLFVGILIVALVLVGIAVYPMITGPKPLPPTPPPPRQVPVDRKILLPPGVHIQGNPKAPYTLVIFSDFQCTHCKETATAMGNVIKKYKDRLNIAYRHFQAAPQHVHAITLAEAAEAAGQQGKFWEMHDNIFRVQDSFETMDMQQIMDALTKMAGDLKLDVIKFREALTGDKARNAVERDLDTANDLKLNVTPSFFVVPPKGQPIHVYGSLSDMLAYLDNPKNW
jgi:protein-disulfide isomerase